MEDVKVFLVADLKKKYQRMCLEEDTKMSTDLREYIERRVNGTAQLNLAPTLLRFLLNKERPPNSEIVKMATKLGVNTEELMAVCDRVFSGDKCINGHD